MADPELLLTVNGADVTDAVWSWGNVTLSDRIDAFAALQVTIRQAFGSVTSVPAFSDIRLVNLLTGAVLFDGVTTDGVTQRAVDPTWVETDIAATDRGVLLASSVMQAAYVYAPHPGEPLYGKLTDRLPELIACAVADRRTNTSITGRPPTLAFLTYLNFYIPISQYDNLWTALSDIASAAWESDAAGATGLSNLGLYCKWFTDAGILFAQPGDAWRGAAPVTLTAASFGRPSVIGYARDEGDLASGFIATGVDFADGTTPVSHLAVNDVSATNGYLIVRGTKDFGQFSNPPDPAEVAAMVAWYWALHGNAAVFYQITTPEMPHDVQVGHSLTFDHPHFGTVTGTVQGVDTTFVDGLYFTDAQAWPEFLDAGLTLDSGWTLDAARTRSIPRRARVSTITLSGNPRSFVKTLRTAGSI